MKRQFSKVWSHNTHRFSIEFHCGQKQRRNAVFAQAWRIYRPTDGPTDGQTDPLTEMRSRRTHLKTKWNLLRQWNHTLSLHARDILRCSVACLFYSAVCWSIVTYPFKVVGSDSWISSIGEHALSPSAPPNWSLVLQGLRMQGFVIISQ